MNLTSIVATNRRVDKLLEIPLHCHTKTMHLKWRKIGLAYACIL